MAKNKSLVLLGFDDDSISEKQKHSLDFKINKIGGKPVSANKSKRKFIYLVDALHRLNGQYIQV